MPASRSRSQPTDLPVAVLLTNGGTVPQPDGVTVVEGVILLVIIIRRIRFPTNHHRVLVGWREVVPRIPDVIPDNGVLGVQDLCRVRIAPRDFPPCAHLLFAHPLSNGRTQDLRGAREARCRAGNDAAAFALL